MFGTLLLIFSLISGNFANLAVKGSLEGLSSDMQESFYLDSDGHVQLDDSEIMLKWGFDALYSNLGYRMIDADSGEEVVRSVPVGVQGALIDAIPKDIPDGYNHHPGQNLDSYRMTMSFADKMYKLDVVRSDLLGKLANEAVLPAIIDVSFFAIMIAFLLFIFVNVVAIRLIVKPVKTLSEQVKKIQPADLGQRIDMQNVPLEMVPITKAFNEALSRVENGFNAQKRFVADAAHELRTPLTILLSRLQLSMNDSELKEQLLSDTKYMSRIVEQLLDLSRAQNVAERTTSSVDLLPVVKDVISLLAPLAVETEHNLALTANVSASFVQADEGELSVVIKNLLENAIKHTSMGSDILVTVEEHSLSVEDSGTGIPQEIREQIFERFWRANKSDLSGSGLGLAITREILSHYDAHISVSTSAALGGAKFAIRFTKGKP